jgi:hypothetical protein
LTNFEGKKKFWEQCFELCGQSALRAVQIESSRFCAEKFEPNFAHCVTVSKTKITHVCIFGK